MFLHVLNLFVNNTKSTGDKIDYGQRYVDDLQHILPIIFLSAECRSHIRVVVICIVCVISSATITYFQQRDFAGGGRCEPALPNDL